MNTKFYKKIIKMADMALAADTALRDLEDLKKSVIKVRDERDALKKRMVNSGGLPVYLAGGWSGTYRFNQLEITVRNPTDKNKSIKII